MSPKVDEKKSFSIVNIHDPEGGSSTDTNTISMAMYIDPAQMGDRFDLPFRFTLGDILKKLPDDMRGEFRSYAVRLFEGVSEDGVLDTPEEHRIFKEVAIKAIFDASRHFIENSSSKDAWMSFDAEILRTLTEFLYYAEWFDMSDVGDAKGLLKRMDFSPLEDPAVLSHLIEVGYHEPARNEDINFFNLIGACLGHRKTFLKEAVERIELAAVDIFENFPNSADKYLFHVAFNQAVNHRGHLRDYFFGFPPPDVVDVFFRAYPREMLFRVADAARLGHPAALQAIHEIMTNDPKSPFPEAFLYRILGSPDNISEAKEFADAMARGEIYDRPFSELLERLGISRNISGSLDIVRFVKDSLWDAPSLRKECVADYGHICDEYLGNLRDDFSRHVLHGENMTAGVFLYLMLRSGYKDEAIGHLYEDETTNRERRALYPKKIMELKVSIARETNSALRNAMENEMRGLEKWLRDDPGEPNFKALANVIAANKKSGKDEVLVLTKLAKLEFREAFQRLKEVANSGRPASPYALRNLAELVRIDMIDRFTADLNSGYGIYAHLPDAKKETLDHLNVEAMRYFESEMDVNGLYEFVMSNAKQSEEKGYIDALGQLTLRSANEAVYNARSFKRPLDLLRRVAMSDGEGIAKEAIEALNLLFKEKDDEELQAFALRTLSDVVTGDLAASKGAWSGIRDFIEREKGEVRISRDRNGEPVDVVRRPWFQDVASAVIGIAEGANGTAIDAVVLLASLAGGGDMVDSGEAAVADFEREEDRLWLRGEVANLDIGALLGLLEQPEFAARKKDALEKLAFVGHYGAFVEILRQYSDGDMIWQETLSSILGMEGTEFDAMHRDIVRTAIRMSLDYSSPAFQNAQALLADAARNDLPGAWMGLAAVAREEIGMASPTTGVLLSDIESLRSADEQDEARREFDIALAEYIDGFVDLVEDGEAPDASAVAHARSLADLGYYTSSNAINRYNDAMVKHDRMRRADESAASGTPGGVDVDEVSGTGVDAGADGGRTIHVKRSGDGAGTVAGNVGSRGRAAGLVVNESSSHDEAGGIPISSEDEIAAAVDVVLSGAGGEDAISALGALVELSEGNPRDPLTLAARREIKGLIDASHEYALFGSVESLNILYMAVVLSDGGRKDAFEAIADVAESGVGTGFLGADAVLRAKEYVSYLTIIYPELSEGME